MGDLTDEILTDPHFTQEVRLLRGGSGDTNSDGYSEVSFDAPDVVSVLITSPDASPFELTETGVSDEVEYALAAPLSVNITQGDRVMYDTGLGDGEEPYMVVEPKATRFAGDELAWYMLMPDTRGEESTNDGDSDSGSETDDGYGTW